MGTPQPPQPPEELDQRRIAKLAKPERLFHEINLLHLEGHYFAFDPKAANVFPDPMKSVEKRLANPKINAEHPIEIIPPPLTRMASGMPAALRPLLVGKIRHRSARRIVARSGSLFGGRSKALLRIGDAPRGQARGPAPIRGYTGRRRCRVGAALVAALYAPRKPVGAGCPPRRSPSRPRRAILGQFRKTVRRSP